MRHGQTIRNYAKAVFAFATLATLGACADSGTVAPVSAKTAAFKAPANFLQVGEAVVFRVENASGAIQRIGDQLLYMPAGAICDLSSSYGATEWNKPCSPLIGSVVITATLLKDADGMPYVDFQPAMRFAPDKEVMLFLRQGTNASGALLTIKYCDNLGQCVDESLTDRSLQWFRVGQTNILGRRIKHFSGYMVTSGEECPAGWTVVDMGNGYYWCTDEGLSRRSRKSGYMVASGESIEEIMKDKDTKGDKKDQQ